MCGITGYMDFTSRSSRDLLADMVQVLHHRGPDDSGMSLFEEEQASVGLGHTRLSIIDLSTAGHQPMHYQECSIVFNGEIYNYKEIKGNLEELGHVFISQSDTEVILHAYNEWGLECVNQFIGMFAFVIYDRNCKQLFLFRDRAGVKPLYYYWHQDLFLFSSELKAFHKHPSFSKEINISALYAYFNFGYIPAPLSIFEHTYKLQAGHIMSFDLKIKELKIRQYWCSSSYYLKPKLDLTYLEAKDKLHDLLKSAYNYRMISDVPVGVFLSGGYDSTSVAAIIQAESSNRLKTFTIGFYQGNNEAPFAKKTAEYLDTEHYEHYCSEKEAQDIIRDLPYYYDEPFADSSAIPTTLVSRIARQYVKVCLSADGGDEIFAGYESYSRLYHRVKKLSMTPRFIRPAIRYASRRIVEYLPDFNSSIKHKLNGFSAALVHNNAQMALNLFKESRLLPGQFRTKFMTWNERNAETDFDVDPNQYHHFIEMACDIDFKAYLQNDILVKVDRATMSASLEGREPMIDHRILEFAAQLPLRFKYGGNTQKRILKDIVHEYIPQDLMNRPKAGFSLPINKWLQGDLNYYLDEYLSERTLTKSGIFNEKFLCEKIKLFRENQLYPKNFVWKLLMFQMWYERWLG